MKNLKIISVLMLFCCITFTSCSKEEQTIPKVLTEQALSKEGDTANVETQKEIDFCIEKNCSIYASGVLAELFPEKGFDDNIYPEGYEPIGTFDTNNGDPICEKVTICHLWPLPGGGYAADGYVTIGTHTYHFHYHQATYIGHIPMGAGGDATEVASGSHC